MARTLQPASPTRRVLYGPAAQQGTSMKGNPILVGAAMGTLLTGGALLARCDPPSGAPSTGASGKLAPAVRAVLRDERARGFIVQMSRPPSWGDLAALRRAGVRVHQQYTRLPMAAVA